MRTFFISYVVTFNGQVVRHGWEVKTFEASWSNLADLQKRLTDRAQRREGPEVLVSLLSVNALPDESKTGESREIGKSKAALDEFRGFWSDDH